MFEFLKPLRRGISSLFQNPKERRHSQVGPAHLWKMKQDFQIKFLKGRGLKPSNKFLDIGCGTLRGGIPIIDYLEVENYYGVEVRDNVLREGRKELKAHNLEYKKPNLYLFSDFAELDFQSKFEVIFAFSVLIHLNDEIARKCLKFVENNLSDTGAFYANVNIETHPDGIWQGFPLVFRSMEFYRELAHYNNLSMYVIGRLKDLGHNSGEDLADKQVMLEFRRS